MRSPPQTVWVTAEGGSVCLVLLHIDAGQDDLGHLAERALLIDGQVAKIALVERTRHRIDHKDSAHIGGQNLLRVVVDLATRSVSISCAPRQSER